MKSSGPWNLRGLRPQAREAARDAARQSGMSVGEWLNRIIERDDDQEAAETWSDDFDRPVRNQQPANPRRRDRIDPDAAPVRPEGRPHYNEYRGEPEGRRREREQHSRNREDRPRRERQRDHDREAARVREEIREAAREAARQEAREAARREAREAARQEGLREAARTREGLGEVHERLDKLSQQLERLSRVEARRPPTMPPARPPQTPSERSDEVTARLTGAPRRRPTRFQPQTDAPTAVDRPPARHPAPASSQELSIEDAVAEIAARQRTLEGEPSVQPTVVAPEPGAVPAPGPSPHPPLDLSALERQLRQITTRIETLRPNDIEDAISAFRTDLTEIERRLTEALPRRALESLEIEIKALAQRIDHSRQSGVDSGALGGLEHGLAEVRDALRALTPAENLVGFDEAVRALAQKVDLIIAREDPAALQQLEAAIGGLRGIVSHVASNDTLTKVAEDVRSLATQIDGLANHAASGRDLSALENRIETLTAALTASTEAGHAVPRELEKLLAGLIEKLEWVQLTHTDHAALAHLEDRIAALVQRFDTSDARLGHLEAIERGLADLLVHLDEMRGGNSGADGQARLRPPIVDAIERDVAEIKQSERRTQDSLDAVQGTVEHVVDRLATIESGLHRETTAGAEPAAELPMSVPGPAPAVPQPEFDAEAEPETSGPQPEFDAEAEPEALVPAEAPAPMELAPPRLTGRPPIDPNLPPNHPLEPGSTAGRSRPIASAADRIAASEAAIGPTKPPVIADHERPNFIAAARRAAQAASWAQSGQQPGGQPGEAGARPNKLAQRLHKLIVAGAVVLIVVGCWHIASRLFDDGSSETPPPAEKVLPPTNSKEAPTEVTPPAKPGQPPSTVPSAPRSTTTPVKPTRQSMIPDGSEQTAVSAAAPLVDQQITAVAAPAWPSADVTGALPRRAATAPATGSDAALTDDKLPATIGGPALRAAAMAGDPAAAYEVATRFAEGRGVPQNSDAAVHWLERAARQGLAPAQFRLGGLYEKGIGVKKDLVAARDLYLAAAEKGNGKAMHNLAVLYAEGINGSPDYHNAALWFRRAADHGITDSQYNLGILYARGIGVEQNYAEAYKWFVLAANQGDQEATKKRDEVAPYLDQKALAAARLAVQSWSPQPQPPEAINVKTAAEWDAPASGPRPAKPKPHPAVKIPDSKPN